MKALILVDIQTDFLPGGALAVPDGDAIIPIVNRLQTKFPLDPTIKTIIYFVVVFAVILWLLQTFGLIHGLGIH